MMKGLFIAFEGIDGAGKTSQIQLLMKYLKNCNYNCISIKGHKAFDGVKEKLLEIDKKIDPFSLFLLSMAKFKTISEEISTIQKSFDYIIIDRYIDTAISYSKANISMDELPVLTDIIPLLKNLYIIPDVTIFIDTPPEVALKRKDNEFDRIELGTQLINDTNDTLFLNNQRFAQKNYKKIASENPQKYIILNGNLPQDEIFQLMIKSLQESKIL